MSTVMTRDRHTPNLFHTDVAAAIGTVVLKVPDGRKVMSVNIELKESVSANVLRALWFSWTRDTTEQDTFTVYLWKPTGTGDVTPLASTVAVRLHVLARTE